MPLIVLKFYGGLRKTTFFCKSDVSAVQGHPRSLILAPIEARMRLPITPSKLIVTLVLSCTVSEILQVFVLLTPPLFHPNFGSVPFGTELPCWGLPEHKP